MRINLPVVSTWTLETAELKLGIGLMLILRTMVTQPAPLKALASYALPKYSRLQAVVEEENEKKCHVLERAGFKKVIETAGLIVFELCGIEPPEKYDFFKQRFYSIITV